MSKFSKSTLEMLTPEERLRDLDLSSDFAFPNGEWGEEEYITALAEQAADYVDMSFDPSVKHFWLPSITTRHLSASEIENIVRAPRLALAPCKLPIAPDFFASPPDQKWSVSSLGFVRVINGIQDRVVRARIDRQGNLIDANSGDVLLARTSTEQIDLAQVCGVMTALLAEFAASRLILTRAVNCQSIKAAARVVKKLRGANIALESAIDNPIARRLGFEAVHAVNDGLASRLEGLLDAVNESLLTMKENARAFTIKLEAGYSLLYGLAPGRDATRRKGPYARFAETFFECVGCPTSPSTIISRLEASRPLKRKTNTLE